MENVASTGGDEAAVCAECGTVLQGAYCHACGQRRLGPEDRRLPHLLGQALSALTDLEGRWLRSLWLLAVDTGALSRAYLEGRRQRYLKPISLFLLVNLLFFLSPPVSDFDLHLQDHFDQPVYGEWAQAYTQRAVEASGTTLDAYTSRFLAESSQVAKSLVILHVPVLAVFLMLGVGFRRWYYAEHVVVALHVFAFLLLAAQLLNWVIFPALSWVVTLTSSSSVSSALPRVAGLAVVAAFVLYSRGVVRAYAVPWRRAFPPVAAALVGLIVSHLLYRFVQFVIVSSLV